MAKGPYPSIAESEYLEESAAPYGHATSIPAQEASAYIEIEYDTAKLREKGVTIIGGEKEDGREFIGFRVAVADTGDENLLIATEDALVEKHGFPVEVARAAMVAAGDILNDHTIIRAMRAARMRDR
jgi:hypothetical protein